MKKVSKDQKPNPHPFYGDNYERGTDPFHISTAPDHLKDNPVWNTGKLKEGWYLLDGFGNEIGFVANGTELESEARKEGGV